MFSEQKYFYEFLMDFLENERIFANSIGDFLQLKRNAHQILGKLKIFTFAFINY